MKKLKADQVYIAKYIQTEKELYIGDFEKLKAIAIIASKEPHEGKFENNLIIILDSCPELFDVVQDLTFDGILQLILQNNVLFIIKVVEAFLEGTIECTINKTQIE